MFLGVKVSFYDSKTQSESGIFLTVNQSSWEKKDEDKKPKKKSKGKGNVKSD